MQKCVGEGASMLRHMHSTVHVLSFHFLKCVFDGIETVVSYETTKIFTSSLFH